MAWTRFRRVTVGKSCDYCVTLATRGAVYHSELTAGAADHDHCDCTVELETEPDRRFDVRIDAPDADRIVTMRSRQNRLHHYDTSRYRNLGVSEPPPATVPKPVGPGNVPSVRLSGPARTPAEQALLDTYDNALKKLPRRTMDPADALKGANPHHVQGREYQQNCTRCVVAQEVRRRGYDVTAAPLLEGEWAEPIAHRVFVYRDASGVLAHPRIDAWVRLGDLTEVGVGLPDGARLWVQWQWGAPLKGAHIVNAEVVDGVATILDGQTGLSHRLSDLAGRVTDVRAIRVDHLDLTDRVSDYVRVG